jgi:predicted phage terminase large subunit-like protein
VTSTLDSPWHGGKHAALTGGEARDAADALARQPWRSSPDLLAEHWSHGQWHAEKHHAVLAAAIVECVCTPNGRLLVQMPPQHGKSSLTTKWTPAWFLHLWPMLKVIAASYGASLASEWGGQVRDVLRDEAFEYGVEIDTSTSAKDGWFTTAGGGMWTAGIGGALTGRGAHLLIIDDPVKDWEEANSVVYRERAWNWYLSVPYTRLAPGASIIVVQTRWHEDDLSGRLEAASENGTGDKWKILRLPAIATEDETHELPLGKTWTRRKGEVLWPNYFTKSIIEARRRTLGPVVFGALYQQAPAPAEGSILKRGWWRRWNGLPDPVGRTDALISVDSTFKGTTDSDYVVIQVWWRYGARKFLVEQIRDRMDYPTFRKTLREMMLRHPECRKTLVEDSANGPAVVADLSAALSGIVLRPAKGSKESRAHAVSGDIESGNVYLPDVAVWREVVDFINECATFPNGAHDDQVDAMTQALLEWPNVTVEAQGSYDALSVLRGTRQR